MAISFISGNEKIKTCTYVIMDPYELSRSRKSTLLCNDYMLIDDGNRKSN